MDNSLEEDEERILKLIDRLQYVINQDPESDEVKTRMLENILLRTFDGQLSPLHTDKSTAI